MAHLRFRLLSRVAQIIKLDIDTRPIQPNFEHIAYSKRCLRILT
jgi:hypothetical protein